MAQARRAGPLEIELSGVPGPLFDLVARTLALYDVPWTLTPTRRVTLRLAVDATNMPVDGHALEGSFLAAAQMLVDRTGRGFSAGTSRGATLDGGLSEGCEEWHLTAPAALVAERQWPEIEDLISLVVTTGWRRAGWLPVHAAGLVRGDRCLIVCATGGGGKTTFSIGLVRRGWGMLGDDKLLVGELGGRLVAAAIKQILNVDPAIVRWFGELGDLSGEPEYSAWSPKRRVALTRFWPHAPALSGEPTHVVVIARRRGRGRMSVERLDVAQTATALLRQTVVPRDTEVAKAITRIVSRVARETRGILVQVPDDAYAESDAFDAVEEALR